jgi:hypothetical protein
LTTKELVACSLCSSADVAEIFRDNSRSFYRCENCGLVSVPPQYFLSPDDEKGRYDLHQNNPNDQNYRTFLSRLFNPVVERLAAGAAGLDFGSGPAPTLSVMFSSVGFQTEIFDPFYAPDSGVLQRQYDFITASEVVEHFCVPRRDLDKIWSCLKRNGILGIMTRRTESVSDFATWFYKNDPTHVAFFSVRTFDWLAHRWGAELEVVDETVVILRKTGSLAGSGRL